MAGAKGKYKKWISKEGLLKIEGWAKDGLTDKQIAHNIGIAEQTLNVWKKKYNSLYEALKRGKEVVDREVENALLKRALGYEYEEVKTENGAMGSKVTKTTKEVTPDTTAQIFWLKNRKPEQWRNKQGEELDRTKVEIELIKEKIKMIKGEEGKAELLKEIADALKGD